MHRHGTCEWKKHEGDQKVGNREGIYKSSKLAMLLFSKSLRQMTEGKIIGVAVNPG
jgi:hypothetical protein